MPISQQQTMTASAVRPLLRFLEAHDIPLNDILQDTLLNETKLKSDRLAISSFDQLLNNVARLTQREDIGFIAGQGLELQSFNLLGFLLSSCETGRDALVTMRRYYMLLSDTPAPEIFITKNEIKVIYHISDGNDLAMRARAELIVTGIHSLGRSLGGNLYQPLKMGFKHSKPKYHDQLEDFFAIDIEYNQPECWISFTAEHVDQPLQYSNPSLFHALRKQAESLLEGYQKLESTSSKVRHVLQQWPNQHSANKEAVAELLNTSPRTLTRRLQEENTQFSHLLRDVRMEKAQIKLENHPVDMQELAHELGFADRRGFERAFKQWSGQTPSAYHKNWKSSLLELEEV
jgi:AraC-like DNA-binding protein